ncbi:MAG: TrmH family RNA methyltransferase [Oliverpabstia sp.]
MITSSGNAQVKQIIQLNKKSRERKKQDVFLVEGLKMFREAPKDRLVKTYVSEKFLSDDEHRKVLEGIEYEVVKDQVFAQMSDTLTPQGILTVVRQYHYKPEQMLRSGKEPFFLVLEDLQDPGNLGTIFRTAEGAGVSGIIMTRNCVDIYHPKTIRSTMGSIYRVPFLCTDGMDEILRWFRVNNITTYAAHLQGKQMYDQEPYQKGTAFFIGNEGNGLTEMLSDCADCWIRIPMEGQLESLNAGVAAGILMYEVMRQRRGQSVSDGRYK